MYLISLYFDEQSNKILQRYIDKIAIETGNSFMTANQVPPHMTISAIEARTVEELIPAFESLKDSLTGGRVQIVSVGQLFPYVMYGAVVVNEYLFDMSNKIYDAYKDIPELKVSKYYKPLSWLPHVTLGKTLDKEQMQKVFSVMQDSFVPLTATVTRIGLAKVHPHEDVSQFELFISTNTENEDLLS